MHSSLKSKCQKPVQFEPIPKWVYDTNTLLSENRWKNNIFHHKTNTFKPGAGKDWYIQTIMKGFEINRDLIKSKKSKCRDEYRIFGLDKQYKLVLDKALCRIKALTNMLCANDYLESSKKEILKHLYFIVNEPDNVVKKITIKAGFLNKTYCIFIFFSYNLLYENIYSPILFAKE